LVVEAGNAMLDDMIASTRRGILVSRFHGLSVLDSREAVITGTTAGGTLLVEDGKLTAALPDLRFVQNLAEAFNNIEMTGDEVKLFGGLWSSFLVPALKLNKFTFLAGNTGQV
jgi:PmbA protein